MKGDEVATRGCRSRRGPLTALLGLVLGVLAALVPVPPATAAVDPGADVPRLPRSCVGPRQLIPQRPGACHIGEFRAGRPTVVLWGDSHAWQLVPALRAATRRHPVNLVGYLMGACPAMDPALDSRRERRRATLCERANEVALRQVLRLDRSGAPLRVVVGGGWQRYRQARDRAILAGGAELLPGYSGYVARMAELMEVGTPRLFTTLGRAGVRVDLVGQVAIVPDVTPPCPSGSDPYACDVPRALSLPDEDRTRRWLQEAAAPLRGERYVEVNDAFCSALVCHGVVDGVYTFFDALHLSATRARSLRPLFGPTVRALR